uniref:Retinoblastoma protein n=1 Tax=Tigriopus japonicus TaxID=158387 RepID=A0A0X9C1Y3_TIGJA|nr:retinoblastoma protein [Tigriopus japonicus]
MKKVTRGSSAAAAAEASSSSSSTATTTVATARARPEPSTPQPVKRERQDDEDEEGRPKVKPDPVSDDGAGSAATPCPELALIRCQYDALCRELNMDTHTAEEAWQSYQQIRQHYTLEGHQLHWLACALYVACHNAPMATVGGSVDDSVEGNGVSLTRLLRSCKLSLIQFFNKAKKWADMSNLKAQFREKIDSLERNFAVSNVIFKKYQPIFVELFKDPAKDPHKTVRSRKQKKPPCTPGDVFDFCWGLFVRVKKDFTAISDDLVNSYHLLLSCVDYVYGNALVAQRHDLLNERFQHPEGTPDEPPCILEQLCRMHDGIITEVKTIREHWWKPHIKKFFDQKLLKGDPQSLTGILDPLVFDVNAKNVRKDYEAYILSIGEYDERVFLGEDANEEIGTPSKFSGHNVVDVSDVGEKLVARRNLNTQFEGSNLIPTTPLSGKHYLRAKEQLKVTPVSTATYLVSRLNALIGRREAEPSQRLLSVFQSCEVDPNDAVVKRVQEMGDTFCSQYTAPSDKHPGSHNSFARMRLKMGVILYYKMLESILISEQKKNKPLANLLEHDLFHQALFACCLEVVIFSYNSQRTFPWILDTLKLEPIHFYKVIEVIIRTEDSLARDVVKHLQRIEEQILESRAWTRESPLWEAILKDPLGVPSCEEVSLPGQHVGEPQIEPVPGQSPLSHHKRPFATKSPMAGDRFKSPVVSAVARRQLAFGDAPNQIAPTSPVRAGQSLLSPQKQYVQVQGQGGGIASSGAVRSLGNGKVMMIVDEDGSTQPLRPKRTGSLALFFRKVYHLAHLRLDLLCHTLQLTDEDIKRKIWTTFEHTMIKHTLLMKDRHMDQLLMCSLYIVCKVVGQDKNFTDIMKNYRNQPQAASHVYRSVLLRTKSDLIAGGNPQDGGQTDDKEKLAAVKSHPTPTKLAASSTIVDGEERGDLIKFYNTVFMERLQEFSRKFRRSRQNEAPPLSPLPKLRAHPQSPCRKVSDNHKVFIRPLKSAPEDKVRFNPLSPHKPLSYSFSRSPAKDLAKINALMRTEVEKKTTVGKRLLTDSSLSSPSSAMILIKEGEPPMKMQILGGSGAVNAKLGLILNDRSADAS